MGSIHVYRREAHTCVFRCSRFFIGVLFAVGCCLLAQHIECSHGLAIPKHTVKLAPSQEIVHPRRIDDDSDDDGTNRRRRQASTTQPSGATVDPIHLQYKFSTTTSNFHLLLSSNIRMISPDLVVERRSSAGSVTRSPARWAYHRHGPCVYHGVVAGRMTSTVAVNVCRGISGLISVGQDQYFIEPVNATDHDPLDDGQPHIITRQPWSMNTAASGAERSRADVVPNQTFCSLPNSSSSSSSSSSFSTAAKKSGRRSRRSVSKERTVETLVVVDHNMMEYHKDQDIETYVLTVMNLVAKFYRDPSIGNLVNVVLVHLLLLEDEQDNLTIAHDADVTLNSFCEWQEKLHPVRDGRAVQYDNAVLLTRKDICRGMDKPCSTLGVAHVPGMCDPAKSCSINEDNGLALGYTIAHEMGHNFGMQHDGAGNPCPSADENHPYVMASRAMGSVIPATWSSCSRDYITRFLDSGMGSCLEDGPTPPYPYHYPEVLPGVMYTADHQCRLQYGHNATVSSMFESDLCSTLWCSVGGMFQSRTPAAQGTRCGKDKWCISGSCLDIEEDPVVIHGGWGSWSEWSECSLTCGTGIKSRERHCDNPSPSHGGKYCVGERKRYALCALQDCPPGSTSVRAMQCSAFDTVAPDGSSIAWIPIANEERACELFCRRRDEEGEPERKSYRVLDGTPCARFSKDLCIDGICHAVGCDNQVNSGAVEDRCGVCHGDGSTCHTVRGSYDTKSGRGYEEVVVIPAGARYIVVEEVAATINYLALLNSSGGSVFNGDFLIGWSGEYQAAGTTISYERIDEKERVVALGPTTEPLHFMLLFRAHNPGITYEYTVPMAGNQSYRPQSFGWVYDDWAPCSASCGVGYQRSSPICTELIAGKVDDRYCEGDRPGDRQQRCNEHQCPATWWVGPWQQCSGSCGKQGYQQRSVFCIRATTHGDQVVLSDADCLGQAQEGKPVTTTTCELSPDICESVNNWKTGEWSQCSTSCGEGWHARSVICVKLAGSCDLIQKPSERMLCLQEPCQLDQDLDLDLDLDPVQLDSYSLDQSSADLSSLSLAYSHDITVNFGEWEKIVAAKKREQQQQQEHQQPQKQVDSSLPHHSQAPSTAIDSDQPPHLQHELTITAHDIGLQKAGGDLRETPSPDSVYMDAIVFHPSLAEEFQPALDGGAQIQHRQTPIVDVEWDAGPWHMCSVSCGQGVQGRDVSCIDATSGHVTTGCPIATRPPLSQACHMGQCLRECRNILSSTICTMVTQSGRCVDVLFRERCCASCQQQR